LACLAVVAYHLRLPGAGGGWLGVDVFFVLSGWLITRLLVRERDDTGGIRLADFYLRRAARLYPALIVACLVSVAIDGVLGRDQALTQTAIGLALTYTTDLWMGVLHLPAVGLGHTWSLAVEEQYYLLWPLLVVGLRRRRRLAWCGGALALLSFWAMTRPATLVINNVDTYFTPHTRAWELLAGSLLALWPTMTAAATPPAGAAGRDTAAGAAGWCGLAILAALTGLAPSPVTPARLVVPAALAVAGAALVVTSCRLGAGPVVTLLECRTLAWLGRRSYAVYLFHPLMATTLRGVPRPVLVVGVLALSIALAEVTGRLVETPVRRWVGRAVAPVLGQDSDGRWRGLAIPRPLAGVGAVGAAVTAEASPSAGRSRRGGDHRGVHGGPTPRDGGQMM
jgi:peptidoglycan/LPS O-acetylase OafA/YrhL